MLTTFSGTKKGGLFMFIEYILLSMEHMLRHTRQIRTPGSVLEMPGVCRLRGRSTKCIFKMCLSKAIFWNPEILSWPNLFLEAGGTDIKSGSAATYCMHLYEESLIKRWFCNSPHHSFHIIFVNDDLLPDMQLQANSWFAWDLGINFTRCAVSNTPASGDLLTFNQSSDQTWLG